jgi:hypothetical protein
MFIIDEDHTTHTLHFIQTIPFSADPQNSMGDGEDAMFARSSRMSHLVSAIQ